MFIGVYGVHRGYIGITEKTRETTDSFGCATDCMD